MKNEETLQEAQRRETMDDELDIDTLTAIMKSASGEILQRGEEALPVAIVARKKDLFTPIPLTMPKEIWPEVVSVAVEKTKADFIAFACSSWSANIKNLHEFKGPVRDHPDRYSIVVVAVRGRDGSVRMSHLPYSMDYSESSKGKPCDIGEWLDIPDSDKVEDNIFGGIFK